METRLTKQIKQHLLQYYRFERDMITVQECWLCDVIACDKEFNVFYEFEIKVSASDLQNELKKDKHKHPTTSYYYFVVPRGLESKAQDMCETLNPKYGVLVYDDDALITYRKAKKLGQPHNYMQRAVLNKLSSDYVNYYSRLLLYTEDRQQAIPSCSPRAEVIYRNLLKTYPLDIVHEFHYVASSNTITYYTHSITFQKTQCKAGHLRCRYKGKWIQHIMEEVDKWITSENESKIVSLL